MEEVAFQTQSQGPEQEERPQCFLSPIPFVEQQPAHSLLLIPGSLICAPGGRETSTLAHSRGEQSRRSRPAQTGQALTPGRTGD